MDTKSWEAVREIFDAALELPPMEREEYVRNASDGNSEVFAEVAALLQAEEGAGDFLETPIVMESAVLPDAVEPPLRKGDLLCHRFRIVRLLGEGGMGHVFEAWDEELGRSVALKAIRPEIASHPESLKRFRREVSLALKITHPNVCRTFDIERDARVLDAAQGASAEVLFLTMEYLEGETLATRLARIGALPLNDALLIATQLADALSCAHDAGILHRDIKPSNIMLVAPAASSGTGSANGSATSGSTLRAVITDFGLARQEALFQTSDLTTVSRTGIPIGTFAYMAPEQLEGADTSPATDVYALGLVLFEMVTGQRAFPSSNPLGSVKERLTGKPPSPKTLVPNLTEPWCRAIEGCLRVHAGERFQSTQEVAAVVHGGRVMLPRATSSYGRGRAPTRPKGWTGFLPDWSPRRLLVGASLLFLLALSLLLGALRLYQSKAEAKVTPGALVYLTQVKNQTGEKAFDNLTELMQAGLTQTAQFNLLDQARIGDTLQHMTKAPDTVIDETIAREIAMRTGAVRVVFATVSGSNGNYKLDVDIQQPDNSPDRYREHWKNTFRWQSSGATTGRDTIPQELSSAVRKATDWIRVQAGESKNDIAGLDIPAEDVTTSNWQALSEFVAAENMHRRNATVNAIQALQNAVRLDPGFSIAWARLGDLLVGLGRNKEGYEAYDHALSLNSETRLPRRERDLIRGEYALDSEDYAAAEGAYRDYSTYFENDYRGWFLRGHPLLMLGRTEESIETLKKAYTIDQNRGNAPWGLARAYISKGNYVEALHWANILKENGDLGSFYFFEGVIHSVKQEYPQARASFLALQGTNDSYDHAHSYFVLSRLEAELGNYEQAMTAQDEGIKEDRAKGNTSSLADRYLAKAYLASNVGAFGECLADTKQAIALDASPQRLIAASTVLGRSLSKTRVSNAAAMKKLLLEIEAKLHKDDLSVVNTIAHARLKGEILLAQGKVRAALAEFQRASKLDAPVNSREYLGRALEIAATLETNKSKSIHLRDEAMSAYAYGALKHNVAWLQDSDALPGLYADQLASYLHLAFLQGKSDANVQQLYREFAGMRRGELLELNPLPTYLIQPILKESKPMKRGD